MTDYIDTREGWSVADPDDLRNPDHCLYEYVKDRKPPYRYWIHETDTPPVALPTEAYTAIEVTWKAGVHNNYRPTKLSLTEKGLWRTLEGQRIEFEPAWFGNEVERFEVLAFPPGRWAGIEEERKAIRRDVAEDIIRRIHVRRWMTNEFLDDLAEEFGATTNFAGHD